MENILAILGVIGIIFGIIGSVVGVLARQSQSKGGADEIKTLMDHLSDRFRTAASEALQANQEILTHQAKLMIENAQQVSRNQLQKEGLEIHKIVEPLKKNLTELETQIREIETRRTGAFATLEERLKELSLSQKELSGQTGNLVSALRDPKTRGSWGELQLKRAVEFAGMTEFVDFNQQVSTTSNDEARLQPDMIIKMPSQRVVVVDAKVSLAAYLDAISENNAEKKKEHMVRHAQQIRTHARSLAKKEYFKAIGGTPEFVVLFLNTESSLSAALEVDPSLIEGALSDKVLIATPTTLIALLKAVAYGWAESKSADKAREVVELGQRLIERFNTVCTHWQKVGDNLNKAVEAFNKASNSTQTRLLVTARELDQTREFNEPQSINQRCVELSSPSDETKTS